MFQLVVAAVLGYALWRIFRPFLGPIVWALLLALLLFPINRRLRRRFRDRRGVAALVLTLAVAICVVVPVALGAIAFAKQAIDLGQALSDAAERHQIAGVQDVLRLPWVGAGMAWLERHASLDPEQVQDWIVQGARLSVEFLLVHGRDLLFGALGLIANDVIARRVAGLLPMDPTRKQRLSRRLQDVTRAVVFGTVVTALVQGALLGIAFWITGLPSPVVFGVLGTIASFIPLIGTSLIWVPASVYLLAQGVLWKAIFMAAWGGLLVGSADNFLRPMLVSGKAEVGTLTVFFGVLGGLAAFGTIGLFLGPVILALAIALIEFAEENLAPASKGSP